MGHTSSIPKHPRKRSLRSPFLKRSSSQKAPISHTFVLIEDDQKMDHLNINLASEEELMTLPGINREIARNIVEYRKAIGRFRKIEDLALVRGIGAEKFENIKSEVCVKLNSSCNSSRAQSYDSLSIDNRSTPRTNRRIIDINNATVFELQCIPGVTQEMAANIMHHRNKKGPFKKVDDLIKVKGIDYMRLCNMRHYLTVEGVPRSTSEILTNGTNGTLDSLMPVNRHRKSSSAPIKFNLSNGLVNSSTNDIFELLSAYCPRPSIVEDYRHSRNGHDVVRIATWNLHEFCLEKAQNLGVREVICRTILENGWSIVCLQEIEDKEALEVICNELNHPKLRRVAEFKQNSREWNMAMLNHQTAVLYDVHSGGIGVGLEKCNESTIGNHNNSYQLQLLQFLISTLDLTVVNVQLPDGFQVDDIRPKLDELVSTDESFLLLGDFSKLQLGKNSIKSIDRLEAILPLHTNTTYSNLKFKYSDNIFVNCASKLLLTGQWGVVRQGLTHLAIPNGWSWGGPVSPHCPLWAEFYIKARDNSEL